MADWIECPKCGILYKGEHSCTGKHSSSSNRKRLVSLEAISEEITSLLNRINLDFVPKTREEDEIIRKVRQSLTSVGFEITRKISS